MAIYVTNDLAFELDEAFEDLTIHELDAPLSGPERRVFSLLIERERLPPTTTFGDVVQEHVREDGRNLPLHRVIELRELRVASHAENTAGYAAIAVVFEWTYRGARHYGRQLHVLLGPSRLCFSATAPFEHREACDQYFDHLTETLRLHPGERHGP